MYVAAVTVKVVAGQGEAFLEATRRNREGTRTEPGNVRYDVLRAVAAPDAEGEPEQFFLYEVYRSPEDFAAHQQTPHYFAWRNAVAPLMAEPRQGVRYVSVLPEPWDD